VRAVADMDQRLLAWARPVKARHSEDPARKHRPQLTITNTLLAMGSNVMEAGLQQGLMNSALEVPGLQ
jgi:hypothetical protein